MALRASDRPRGLGWGSLRGAPTPSLEGFDVRRWTGPHTFRIHCREGLFWFWYFLAIGLLNLGFLGGDAMNRSGAAPQTHAEHLRDLATLIALMVVPALVIRGWFELRWRRLGGWLTIDPDRRELVWVRPRGTAPERTWTFDDLNVVRFAAVASSAGMRLDLGDRRLVVRVPRAAAIELPNSLRQMSGAHLPAAARRGALDARSA